MTESVRLSSCCRLERRRFMRVLLSAFSIFATFAALTAVYLHGLQPVLAQTQYVQNEQHRGEPAEAHEHGTTASSDQGMAGMMAGHANLDELVTKMNAATGSAKTDAIAELLTALVREHEIGRAHV